MHEGNIIEATKRMKEESKDLSALIPTWVSNPKHLYNLSLNSVHLKIREAATGIKYLHEHHIIHGDIRGVSAIPFHKIPFRLKDIGQHIP